MSATSSSAVNATDSPRARRRSTPSADTVLLPAAIEPDTRFSRAIRRVCQCAAGPAARADELGVVDGVPSRLLQWRITGVEGRSHRMSSVGPIDPARSRIVFMCGPAGSGKSTVAHALERLGFARLSVDAEAHARGWTGVITREQALQIDVVLRARLDDLLRAGRDVVLDYSFSTRAVRDEYRLLLHERGIPVTVFVRTPRTVALSRLALRRDAHGDDVAMAAERAARYFDAFEVPTPDEGPLVVCEGTTPADAGELLARIDAARPS